jgi:anthranilate phosphoribosyltransferase
VVEDLAAGVNRAREIIRSGAALAKLDALAAFTQSL